MREGEIHTRNLPKVLLLQKRRMRKSPGVHHTARELVAHVRRAEAVPRARKLGLQPCPRETRSGEAEWCLSVLVHDGVDPARDGLDGKGCVLVLPRVKVEPGGRCGVVSVAAVLCHWVLTVEKNTLVRES